MSLRASERTQRLASSAVAAAAAAAAAAAQGLHVAEHTVNQPVGLVLLPLEQIRLRLRLHKTPREGSTESARAGNPNTLKP